MDTATLKALEERRGKLLDLRLKQKDAMKETKIALDEVDLEIHAAIAGMPLFDAETGEVKE